MKLGNLSNEDIKIALVKILKFMGYTNDYPDKEYSIWYKGEDLASMKLQNVESLMSNEVALMFFLLQVTNKIGLRHKITIICERYDWNVSIEGESVLNHSRLPYEALFLSINDYINKKL